MSFDNSWEWLKANNALIFWPLLFIAGFLNSSAILVIGIIYVLYNIHYTPFSKKTLSVLILTCITAFCHLIINFHPTIVGKNAVLIVIMVISFMSAKNLPLMTSMPRYILYFILSILLINIAIDWYFFDFKRVQFEGLAFIQVFFWIFIIFDKKYCPRLSNICIMLAYIALCLLSIRHDAAIAALLSSLAVLMIGNIWLKICRYLTLMGLYSGFIIFPLLTYCSMFFSRAEIVEILPLSWVHRIYIWQHKLDLFFSSYKSFLFGHGFGYYKVMKKAPIIIKNGFEVSRKTSHCFYIDLLFELGLLATIAICIMVYIGLSHIFRNLDIAYHKYICCSLAVLVCYLGTTWSPGSTWIMGLLFLYVFILRQLLLSTTTPNGGKSI